VVLFVDRLNQFFAFVAIYNVVVNVPIGQQHICKGQFVRKLRHLDNGTFFKWGGKTLFVLNFHINVQNTVEQNVEAVDVVCDGHTWDVAHKFFGGKAQPAHKSLPQTALSII
jgi:hypothetical protein